MTATLRTDRPFDPALDLDLTRRAVVDEQARIMRRAVEARIVPMVEARKIDVTVTTDEDGQLVLAGFHFRVTVTFEMGHIVATRVAKDSGRACGTATFDGRVGPSCLAPILLTFAD